jgi:hypothetical protein
LDLEIFPSRRAVQRFRSGQSRHAVLNFAQPVRLMGRMTPAGQVTVRSTWFTVKSSTVNRPGTAVRTGAGLITSMRPCSASPARNSPGP